MTPRDSMNREGLARGLAAALLLVSSMAAAQGTFDCQTLQVRAPASGTAMNPKAVATVPADKLSQGYVRVGGGCEVSRAGFDSTHAEVMVQNSPDGDAGWKCKGADPATLPNAAWAKASVTFCRASDPAVSSLRLQCTVLTKKTGPSRNPAAEVTLTQALIDEGYTAVSGGCDSSHSQNGSTHAENVVISKPASNGLGWSCQAADPPGIGQDATVEASLVACKAAISSSQAASLGSKPSLVCNVTQGAKGSGTLPKSIVKPAAGRVLGGGCELSYAGHGSAHAEFMVQQGPQDGSWACLAADPPGISNPGSAQASVVSCEVLSLVAPAASTAKEAGPLASQADADKKCPSLCTSPLRWNGQWWTTSAGKSVCACAEPPPAIPAPPAAGTTKSADYKWDESTNRGGPTSCMNDNMCDGLRTCGPNHWCVGPLRVQPPKSEAYTVDEAKNVKGPSRCAFNTDCDGLRTCSQVGYCQGTARVTGLPPKGPGYRVDESKNSRGPNRCSTDRDCDGSRTCNEFGLCYGKARGGLDLCDYKEYFMTTEAINNNIHGCR